MTRAPGDPSPGTSWNGAHLGLLVLMALFAAGSALLAWPPLATLAGGLVLALAWLGLAEWWRPHRPEWVPARADLRRDTVFFGLAVAVDALGGLMAGAGALALAAYLPATGLARLPLGAAIPLALLVATFGDYWLHRLMHRGGWWWRVHAVHHRPTALNLGNSFTAHPLNVLSAKLVKVLPLALLGFSVEAVLYAGLFLQTQSLAVHANTPGRMGWFNRLIGTAELHRHHHSVHAHEALNFGTALPFWDQLFGTWRGPALPEPAVLGLASGDPCPQPLEIGGLLWYPLRRVRPDNDGSSSLKSPHVRAR